MKLAMALVALIGLSAANPRPQIPTPDTPPPPLSSQLPEPTTTSTSTSPKGAPPPAPTREPPVPEGPICECGYTYCASVLMGMSALCEPV